jgi:phenylalanyl-tRNA synthetase beta chain
VRVFETGLTFSLEGEQIQQTPVLGGLIAGDVYPAGWADAARKVDFYDLKGDVENLLAMSHLHGRVHFEVTQSPEFHPGQCAAIMLEDKHIGIMGQLHPQWQKPFGVNGAVFMFQIFIDSLLTMQVPKVSGISKFPEVQRDLAFVINNEVAVKTLMDCVQSVKSTVLQQVQVFDIYQGEGVEEGCKSVALSLKIQHQDRTLLDDEVDVLIDSVIQRVKQELNAELR